MDQSQLCCQLLYRSIRCNVDCFYGEEYRTSPDFCGFKFCIPFCLLCDTAQNVAYRRELQLYTSQPTWHMARRAIETKDIESLQKIILSNPKFTKPTQNPCASDFAAPCGSKCNPFYICGYKYCTPSILPAASINIMLRQSNPALHDAIKAIESGNYKAFAKVLKQQPDAETFLDSKYRIDETKQEAPCHDTNCFDCTCCGAERCDGGAPRRLCGHAFCHFPILCCIPLFRFPHTIPYYVGNEGAAQPFTGRACAGHALGTKQGTKLSLRQLICSTGDPAFKNFLISPSHSTSALVKMRMLNGDECEFDMKPGDTPISELLTQAQHLLPDLHQTSDSIQTTRSQRHAKGLVDAFDVIADQPDKVHFGPRFLRKSVSEKKIKNREVIWHNTTLLDVCCGADRGGCKEGGKPRRCCGDAWCHMPLACASMLVVSRMPVEYFRYETEVETKTQTNNLASLITLNLGAKCLDDVAKASQIVELISGENLFFLMYKTDET